MNTMNTMNGFDEYIAVILKGTLLTRREKGAWAEEMSAHLEEAADWHVRNGMSPDEARQQAIAVFGSVWEIRRRVIRETYGLSPRWSIAAAAVSAACLLLVWWVNMRSFDIDPVTMASIPTPAWVLAVRGHLIMSPDAWVALTVLLAMYVFTRKRADRAALFAWAALLGLVWSVDRISHHMGALGQVFFAQGSALWVPPFGPQQLAGYVLLFALSLAAYAWTRSRTVSLALWVATVAFTVWPYIANSVQATLYHATGNPVFWGHTYPDIYTVIWGVITLAARVVVLLAFLYGCRRIDRTGRLHRVTTA